MAKPKDTNDLALELVALLRQGKLGRWKATLHDGSTVDVVLRSNKPKKPTKKPKVVPDVPRPR